jgi:hypothetical protein
MKLFESVIHFQVNRQLIRVMNGLVSWGKNPFIPLNAVTSVARSSAVLKIAPETMNHVDEVMIYGFRRTTGANAGKQPIPIRIKVY